MLEPRALSSACLVLCWSVVFGSRHSCLESGSGTRAPCSVSLCERAARVRSAARSLVHVCCVCVVLHAVRVFIGCVHSCYVLCCVARSLCFSLAACFHVVVSCVNTRLMSIRVLFCTWLVICFAGHVLVFCFV